MNDCVKYRALSVVRWLLVVLLLAHGVDAQDRRVEWKLIQPPADWQVTTDSWITTPRTEWERFQESLTSPTSRPQAPVVLQATYSARFDGDRRLSGDIGWQLHHIEAQPGFLTLGATTLAVTKIHAGESPVAHGLNPRGEWQLWSAGDEAQLKGQWSQWGESRLSSRVFDLQLPRALSSRLELELPRQWEARVSGVTPEIKALGSGENRLWVFDLGRQLTVPLRIEPAKVRGSPRILVRENSVYRLTTTDDLIRLRSEFDCQVDASRDSELVLAVPKPLRVFNVMLSGEVPVAFERDLGSETDQIRIPLRALTAGQRVSIQLLAETRRNSDKASPLPRIRPLNASLQEGTLQLEIDRPLEIRSVETKGLRQVRQTEEAGKEYRSYELLQADGQLSVNVGEPVPVSSGEVRFLADMRGESPQARARVRMSTREGELYSPQIRIPAHWDPISVTLADTADTSPAAWHTSPLAAGDTLIGLELKQPIRPDRDCTVLIDLKSTRKMSSDEPLRLPAPQIVAALDCYAQGVLWDDAAWELRETSPTSAELDNEPPDVEMLLSLNWGEPPAPPAVPTGVRLTNWTDTSGPQFQRAGVTYAESDEVPGLPATAGAASLLSAHVELNTTTTRIATSHVHLATFRLNQPVRPADLELSLPVAAIPVRISSKDLVIPFVRQGDRLLLDASVGPLKEFNLEYRTEAQSGWVVARDAMSFPRISCFVTEFAWHLNLDPQRRLYKLPLTAAATRREQPPIWQRLLGPLSRVRGESLFNPLHREDWRALINGTIRDEAASRREELWFVAPRIPDDLPIKTWNIAVTEGLAWAALLLLLALGIALRRARSAWFRRTWIYLGGAFLVLAVFVGEPYAPIAGGGFLGSVLAILVPRRFAIGADWLASQPRPRAGLSALGPVVGCLTLFIGLFRASESRSVGQDDVSLQTVPYFEVPSAATDPDDANTLIRFDSSLRARWDAWKAMSTGADWLLSRSDYRVEETSAGPPVITATFELLQFGDRPVPLKIPLDGVSLERIEGILDGQNVRLIPATDSRGFVLPLVSDTVTSADGATPPPPPMAKTSELIGPRRRTLEIKFRLLADPSAERGLFSGTVPALPESTVTLPPGWNLSLGAVAVPTIPDVPIPMGPVQRMSLSALPNDSSNSDNLVDVGIRTLVECGALGARVQTGVQATLSDPTRPAIVRLSFPGTLWIQSIRGPAVLQSEIDYSDAAVVSITLALQPGAAGSSPEPIEILSFLPGGAEGFDIHPPVWLPPRSSVSLPGTGQSLVGVVAKPGLQIRASDQSEGVTPISPQAFSDSLFSGIVWQVPDLAWSCRRGDGPVWTAQPIISQGKAQIQQTLTIDLPRSRWLLEGKMESNLGTPFEHQFVIDPRIDIQRASVLQDGAERLLRWTITQEPGNARRLLRLTIRDGQPGVQSVRVEGSWATQTGDWSPPETTYQSGLTIDSSTTIKHSPRVTSEIQSEGATTRGDVDKDFLYRPGELNAPRSIRINPIHEERHARAWIDMHPRDDSSWLVTVRAQLKDKLPASQPIRITWETPGVSDLRPANRRENVRPLTKGKGLQWRPQSTSTRPAEMTITAVWNSTQASGAHLPLPTLSGVRWSEVWMTFPKGAGYRPVRRVATVASEAPTGWPATWSQSLSGSRLDLYEGNLEPLEIEEYSDDSTVRPLWAESLVWMGQFSSPSETEPSLVGMTKYLLISERTVTLKIPEAARPHVRAISVNGEIQAADQPVRLLARNSDLSQEVIVWWETLQSQSQISGEWLEFPGSQDVVHHWAVVPPHQEFLLTAESNRRQVQADYWLSRTELMLRATTEFRGAPWRVDGPLLHHLADSRNELSTFSDLSPQDAARREKIDIHWKEFTGGGSHISSPVTESRSVTPEIGLDAAIALCGDSRSLWMPDSSTPAVISPRMLDRRWALAITATLASLVSLGILMWFVRLFRRFEIPERLAARPNASLIGMGIIWWLGLSPSVLGLALTLMGIILWLRGRWSAQAVRDSTLIPPRASDYLPHQG